MTEQAKTARLALLVHPKGLARARKVYKNLQKLGILYDLGSPTTEWAHWKAPAMMDLSVEAHPGNRISLAHYGEQNGDLMADPDMMVIIDREAQAAFGETWQNDYVGVYHDIYFRPGVVNLMRVDELTSFLLDWTKNLIDGGWVKEEKKAA